MKSPRSVLTSMILLLIFAAMVPFTLPLKDGKPLLEFKMPKLGTPKLPDISLPQLGGEERNPEVAIYRWKDANGVLQYSNTPPQGVNYETQTVDADANLIQGVSAAPEPAKSPVAKPKKEASVPSGLLTPGKALETMNDAQNVEKMLQDRKSAQDQALGSY